MKRLLRVSLDILVTSIVPISGWFLLGILVEPNLINIFTLTYPIQFIMSVLQSLFAVGPNIYAYKENHKNDIDSGIILGIFFGTLIFGFIIFNIDKYISFMGMNVECYRIFGIYSVMQIYLQLLLYLIITKLYYKEENKKANKISIIFNLVNFSFLIIPAIFIKNQVIISAISLVATTIIVIYLLIKNIDKFKFSIHIFKWIKYDSVDLSTSIMFFLIYLFGLSRTINYGEEYTLALSFATLITDMQWDITHSIGTVAKIDITKNKFKYMDHLKNALKLIGLILISIIIMFLTLYPIYNCRLDMTLIYVLIEIICFIVYPLYCIKICYMQIEYSALKTTVNKQIAETIRFIFSFIPSPYCTGIGQLFSMVYQLIYSNIVVRFKNNELKEERIKSANNERLTHYEK